MFFSILKLVKKPKTPAQDRLKTLQRTLGKEPGIVQVKQSNSEPISSQPANEKSELPTAIAMASSLLNLKQNSNLFATSSNAVEKTENGKGDFDKISNGSNTSENTTPAKIQLKELKNSFHEFHQNLSTSPLVPNDVNVAYSEGNIIQIVIILFDLLTIFY